MRPTLRQLQYLIAIAETGHFGVAAKRVNVSQPSLSTQVGTMEDELGVVLIERGRQGAILTLKGEETVRRARLILRDMEELKGAARHSPEMLSGHLRLGVLPTIGPYLLPLAARRLHILYPELRCGVEEMRSTELERHLHDGRFDIIISSAGDHTNCTAITLFQERMWICIASDDLLAKSASPISFRDLKGRALISHRYWPRLDHIVKTIADKSGAHVTDEYEGTSLDAIRQMAEMGAGIAVLPGLYALTEIRRDPQMLIRRIDSPLASRKISLICRDTSHLGQGLENLADIMRETAQEILSVDR